MVLSAARSLLLRFNFQAIFCVTIIAELHVRLAVYQWTVCALRCTNGQLALMNPAQNSLRVVMGLKYSHTFLDVLPEMETNTLPWAGTGPGDLCLMNTIKQKRWSPVLEPRSLKGTLCSCGFLFGITHSEGSQMRCRANKCSDSYRERFMWQNLNLLGKTQLRTEALCWQCCLWAVLTATLPLHIKPLEKHETLIIS